MLPLEEMRALFDQEQRIAITYPDAQKDVFPNLVRFTCPAPSMNFIRYSRPPTEDLDAVIQAQIDDLAPRNQPFEWQVYDTIGPLRSPTAWSRMGLCLTTPRRSCCLTSTTRPPR